MNERMDKRMDLKRVDLIQQLVSEYAYTKQSATDIVDGFTKLVIDNMRRGNTITIHNFGCFDMLERAERRCPNPATGEPMVVPAHWIPRFYPGRAMRNAVKLWEDDEKRGRT